MLSAITTELDQILDRVAISDQIKKILHNFDANSHLPTFKKGIYIYGSPGCGKTFFVKKLLKEMNYDTIHYDAGDIRNKAVIETITSDNISNKNVLTMMTKKAQKIAIMMDEIDGMNNGDKGSITSLIKLIRQKKTKKQKLESKTMNPIVCVGNYFADKKIKELMKVCNVFELAMPTDAQMTQLIYKTTGMKSNPLDERILRFIQGDLRKLEFIIKLHKKNPAIFSGVDSKFAHILNNIFQLKTYNDDSKKITQNLLHHPVELNKHNVAMNETDRTIVALLWHENIIDCISQIQPTESNKFESTFPLYLEMLKNICFADYIDRITFQNQIWQFNEMSSLLKTLHNNKIYHDYIAKRQCPTPILKETRFTKVLTKYSTEYNNTLFIHHLCNELEMDKKDLVAFFQDIRLVELAHKSKITETVGFPTFMSAIEKKIGNSNIDKLDIRRMYRYLDKNVKKDVVAVDIGEEDDDDDDTE